jgi:hypothetical protein
MEQAGQICTFLSVPGLCISSQVMADEWEEAFFC